MKKIILLVTALVAVIATLSAGTFAYFNDVETSAGNVITAGTLNLVPAQSKSYSQHGSGGTSAFVGTLGDGVAGHVTFTDVSPGQSGTITFTLYNSGTIDGVLTISSTVSDTPADHSSTTTPDGIIYHVGANSSIKDLGLGEFLGVRVTRGDGADADAAATDLAGDPTYVYGSVTLYGILDGLQAALNADTLTLNGTSSATHVHYTIYQVEWKIESGVKTHGAGLSGKEYNGGSAITASGAINGDNLIQGDAGSIGITFTLTQAHS